MARTKQTARKSTGGRTTRVAVDAEPVDTGLTKEERKQQEVIMQAEMKVEIKRLERRHDSKGHQYVAEQKVIKTPAEKIDWWQKFAICITRQLDYGNKIVQSISVQINSPCLKDMLKNIIGNYPGQSFMTKTISIDFPARCLFHYRHEIRAFANKLEMDSEAAEHVDLLTRFIDEEFAETISEGENLIEQGLISYEHLWTIFRPGTTVYARSMGQPRAYTLLSYQYQCGMRPCLSLSVSYIDYDGEQFGKRETTLSIPQFRGAQRILDFNVYPVSFSSSETDLKAGLIARGREFESLAGQNFRTYKGIGLEFGGCAVARYSVDGRVMIDCETFHRLNANAAFEVTAFSETETPTSNSPHKRRRRNTRESGNESTENAELLPTKKSQLAPLTDEQCLLCNATVRGFSFSEKKFLDFFVDKLSPIDWNSNCFDQLVLPAAQKDLVRALVATHSSAGKGNGFDDIVKGKGRGLILVLHGPPGVGKTLTAECVAEFSKRPLYIVSSGDLGTHSEALDERLSRIMDMASTWKAVLLIDEADVFLEERSSHDVERNSLVSIFLRVLEYYEGILFLTTNRVATFDDAFKSRIHVPLKYNNLSQASRRTIWKNLLAKIDNGVDVDEKGYDRLSEQDLNGRQVKNVVRTAGSLAQFNGRRLDLKQLEQVVTIQLQFEQDLVGVHDAGLATPSSGRGE